MNSPEILRIAFAANIVILVPVCWSMFASGTTTSVFGGAVDNSDGLRLLVGCLWFAILVASIGGLFRPAYFAPVVLIQVMYKLLWLLTFVLPAIRNKRPSPTGIAIVFLLIVVTYPVLYWRAQG